MDDYTNAWNSFFETGNISDYLNYKHAINNHMKDNKVEFGNMEFNNTDMQRSEHEKLKNRKESN